MSQTVHAAVTLGGGRVESRDVVVPASIEYGGWLQVEATGVCGSDIHRFLRPAVAPVIQGHEIVGRIAEMTASTRSLWSTLDLEEGDRILIEEYLPCGVCPLCRSGEYRLCPSTARLAGGLRYGATSTDIAPSLWGGYAEKVFLHPRAVIHRLPEALSSVGAAVAFPLSNGIQWVQIDSGLRPGNVVAVIGPGQMGLCCVAAAKSAGAGMVIAIGLLADEHRLKAATALGADYTVAADREDTVEVVRQMTNGRLADVVIDVSSGPRDQAALAIQLAGVNGTICAAASNRSGTPSIDVEVLKRSRLTVRACRGHSYEAVERAIQTVAQHSEISAVISGEDARFGIDEVGTVLGRLASPGGDGLIHATIVPEIGSVPAG